MIVEKNGSIIQVRIDEKSEFLHIIIDTSLKNQVKLLYPLIKESFMLFPKKEVKILLDIKELSLCKLIDEIKLASLLNNRAKKIAILIKEENLKEPLEIISKLSKVKEIKLFKDINIAKDWLYK